MTSTLTQTPVQSQSNGHTTMNGLSKPKGGVASRLYHAEASVSLEDFKQICSRTTDKNAYPLATSVQSDIPIYNAPSFNPTDSSQASALQDEWYDILESGPGIFVLKGMYDPSKYNNTLTATNAAFQKIIDAERRANGKIGDHFAAGGKNDRIWNSLSKHAFADPASFADYYSNPWLQVVSESWLGPAYRVTAQVNIVKPGGAAQDSHRDYHLGFQDLESCAAFPRSIQLTSQYLTLQGAVAHSDMPKESGPTRFLPFSQTYRPGYLAWRRDDFRAFFQENYVALPLSYGDGLFFNPAVFHAAGANETEPAADGGFHRKANLLQIGCAMGKTMESIDAVPIVERCWDEMVKKYKGAGGVDAELGALVRAIGEGYPFPTNLDQRPPAPNGMAPESEQELLIRGLQEGWTTETAVKELRQLIKDSGTAEALA
ncbi:phytanoyl-CoA dioxygenase family protein [Aspergillus stella-maris]|uniref:phytanoyl-CoA dioxygenase family protein n=1 Tax=Aspergillus stella-maris TaxID=1810926 RepID=UPI003CCE3D1A